MNVFKIVFNICSLISRLILLSPKVLYNKKKGAQSFKKALLEMGIDSEVAKALSKSYESSLNLGTLMPNKHKEVID